MIKEFQTESDCLKWLRSEGGKKFKWYGETKRGTYVGVIVDFLEDTGGEKTRV